MARIRSETARMGELVEDLLLLARLDEGRPLEREPVELRRASPPRPSTPRERGRTRAGRSRSRPTGPSRSPATRPRLRQVLDNLLAQRAAPTPRPAPPVDGRASAPQDGEARARGRRRRAGPDAERRRARLRALLPRRRVALAPSTAAPGLGLAIVAAIVEAHGGNVTVSRRPRAAPPSPSGSPSPPGGRRPARRPTTTDGRRSALTAAPPRSRGLSRAHPGSPQLALRERAQDGLNRTDAPRRPHVRSTTMTVRNDPPEHPYGSGPEATPPLPPLPRTVPSRTRPNVPRPLRSPRRRGRGRAARGSASHPGRPPPRTLSSPPPGARDDAGRGGRRVGGSRGGGERGGGHGQALRRLRLVVGGGRGRRPAGHRHRHPARPPAPPSSPDRPLDIHTLLAAVERSVVDDRDRRRRSARLRSAGGRRLRRGHLRPTAWCSPTPTWSRSPTSSARAAHQPRHHRQDGRRHRAGRHRARHLGQATTSPSCS